MDVVGAGMGLTVLDGSGSAINQPQQRRALLPKLLTIRSGGVTVAGLTIRRANSSALANAAPVTVTTAHDDHNGGSWRDQSPPRFVHVELRDLIASTGSVFVDGGHLVLDGCKLYNNVAVRGEHGGHQLEWSGGGVFVNKGQLTAVGTHFERQRALVQGGAIMNNMGHVHAINCTFLNNSAASGGALYTFMWGGIIADGCHFEGNWAGQCEGCHAGHEGHGGAIFTDRGWVLVRRSTFLHNKNPIWAWSTRDSKGCHPCLQNVTIERSHFWQNFVNGSGAALANQWSRMYVKSSVFESNHASKLGGVLWNDVRSETTFENCTFTSQNSAGKGGAVMYNDKGTVTISNDSYYIVSSKENATEAALSRSFTLCDLEDLHVIAPHGSEVGDSGSRQ